MAGLLTARVLSFAQPTRPKPADIDTLKRYVALVHRATQHDAEVTRGLLREINLLAPPASLLAPGMVLRVLRANWKRRGAPVSTQPEAAH